MSNKVTSGKKKYLQMIDKLEKLLGNVASWDEFRQKIEDHPDLQEELSSKTSELLPLPELEGKLEALGIYTDGACRGNPGPGAWAYLVQDAKGEIIFENVGGEKLTTNNRMELTAIIEALGILEESQNKEREIYLYTDSRYAVDGLNQWIPQWKQRGWKKADNKTPENVDLWQRLDQLNQYWPHLHIKWVKGHAGHAQNERCDQMCNKFLDHEAD